jgi:hypothetical protein
MFALSRCPFAPAWFPVVPGPSENQSRERHR